MRHLDFQHLRNLSFARNKTKQSGTQDIEEGQNQERQPSADRPPGTALDDCRTLHAAFELEASPEWCDWYAGLSKEQRETLKKVLDESFVLASKDLVNTIIGNFPVGETPKKMLQAWMRIENRSPRFQDPGIAL